MNRICFYFESYYVGGLDTFVIQLINNWPCDDEITLMCNKSHSGAMIFTNKITNLHCTVEIHNMPMVNDWAKKSFKYSQSGVLHALFKVVAYICLIPRFIFRSYEELKLSRFDSLMTINGGYPACLSSRCVSISWWKHTGKKSIHNFHNFTVRSSKLMSLIDGWIDKQLVKSVSKFISVSKVCAESLRIRPAFSELSNIMHIYNGISDDVVQPSFDLRMKLSLSSDTKLLLMLATYEERKGHKYIIDVMKNICALMDNVHLVFLGYGSKEEKKNVEDYAVIKGVQNSISFLDYKGNAMEYLAQTDLLLIGSQRFESFGLTAVEAMKYHKVVLSTNTGGLKEVIKDNEGGFLFESDDSSGMADKAVALLTDSSLMSKQKNLAYSRYFSNFQADRMAREYKSIID